MSKRKWFHSSSKDKRIMKLGDLVKVTKSGLRQLDYVSQLPGIIVDTGQFQIHDSPKIVYVCWPDRTKPLPMNVRWLEVFDG